MKKYEDKVLFRYYMSGLLAKYLEKRYNKVLVDIFICKDGKCGFNIRLLENASKGDAIRLLNDIRNEFDIKDCHIDNSTCLNWIYGRMSHNKLENIRTLIKMNGV